MLDLSKLKYSSKGEIQSKKLIETTKSSSHNKKSCLSMSKKLRLLKGDNRPCNRCKKNQYLPSSTSTFLRLVLAEFQWTEMVKTSLLKMASQRLFLKEIFLFATNLFHLQTMDAKNLKRQCNITKMYQIFVIERNSQ